MPKTFDDMWNEIQQITSVNSHLVICGVIQWCKTCGLGCDMLWPMETISNVVVKISLFSSMLSEQHLYQIRQILNV